MTTPPDPKTSVVVASISGGKDSAAMSLYLLEQGIEHRRVFADTEWEHPSTYEHLAYLETVLGPIDRVRSKHGGMEQWVRKKGMFPSRVRRFCTQELKVRPIKAFIAEHEAEVNPVGIRAGESDARAKMDEWEWNQDFDCWTWRPIIRWGHNDVVAIHKRHGVRPHPLYLQGATRVGCWPCIFARKAEVKLIADIDPERIDRIEQLEQEVEAACRARYVAEGTTLEDKGYHAPTFFHVKAAAGNGGMVPIRQIAAWSRTSRGGRQLTLLDDAPEGCVRWGMCEHDSL